MQSVSGGIRPLYFLMPHIIYMYNIYHFCNSVVAAFLGRLHLMEKIHEHSTNRSDSLERLFRGRGFDTVMAWRPPPTDWQQQYADVLLGSREEGTKYLFMDQILQIKGPLCFDEAHVAGASLYLSSGIGNAQLIRHMTEKLKGIRIREGHGWTRQRFQVTWFVREDKRQILNLPEAKAVTEQVIREYNAKFKTDVNLALVSWTDRTPFLTQAGVMGRTRVFISTHGSALNHCMFMDTGGSVVEINAHQFRYPLDDLIILQQGHHYFRYSASMNETQVQGMNLGEDPFGNILAAQCNAHPHCIVARRDAGIRINLDRWAAVFKDALESI
jgi:hypothetical protein